MKKRLLLAAVVMVATGVVAVDAYSTPLRATKEKTENGLKKSKHREPALDRGQWQPTLVKYYSWNDESNAWNSEATETSYLYDEKGLLVEEKEGTSRKITYTYNENDKVVERISYDKAEEADDWVESGKEVYEYDSVVTDFPILEESYYRNYETGKLTLAWSEKHVITRDDNGNVIKVQQYSKYNGDEDYTSYEYFTVEYDAEGVASVMTLYYIDEDEDEDELRTQLKDIVWESTNGQILEMNDDIDEEDWFIGSNRIKSAVAVKADDMPDNTTIEAVYSDKQSFEANIKYGNQLIWNYSVTYTDKNGSYKALEKSY